MILHPLDLTSALRPALLPDETLLFVQDKVGLYQGNLKHADYQNGQIYLTSHRACYIDNDEPRDRAVAVLLKDVDRCEAGFLKSSPKVTLHPKAAKQFRQLHRAPPHSDGISAPVSASPRPLSLTPKPAAINATWICPICSFSNPVPPNFDPATANDGTPLAPCGTCGMTPPLVTLVKAALAAKRTETPRDVGTLAQQFPQPNKSAQASICPRCTFENHTSMTSCEICGAPLNESTPQPTPEPVRWQDLLSESPGPASPASSASIQKADDPQESTKLSFRAGGEKIFLERLRGALIQRKWMLQRAPPELPTPSGAAIPPALKNIGISGLERRDRELRKNNELVIGNAFEDLSALMASAKEIIAIAENFAKSNNATGSSSPAQDQSQTDQATHLLSSLNLTTTKDMLGSSASSSSSAQHTTYLSQLARSITDFLLDDTSGNALLKSSGGIISLVDLWAVYNRARGGVELVSPMDFSEAVDLFEKLRLPVQARVFRGSGLRVVRGSEWSDERVVKALISWLRDLRRQDVMEGFADGLEQNRSGMQWGRGVTALEAADRFGWSVGVAGEELAMAEERGALCREVGLEGVKFWKNWFTKDLAELAGLEDM